MGDQSGDGGSSRLESRAALAVVLAGLKRASPFSYKDLSRKVARPVSTLHGWISARHLPHPRDNDDFVRLVGLLGADDSAALLAAVVELRRPSKSRGSNPYMGLEAFAEGDSGLFFGRSGLTDDLVERTRALLSNMPGHPLVVIGASGSGKTSVLRAGLLARLRVEDESLSLAYVTPDGVGAQAMLGALRSRDEAVGGRVVVLDQFEECFSSARDGELDKVVDCLAEFCAGPANLLVVGVRSDFFHRLAEVPLLLRGLQDSPLVVGPMSLAEVTESIVQPASKSGLQIAPGLLGALIHEFGDPRSGNGVGNPLPLLSHVLHVLAESTGGSELRLDHYRSRGGLGSALERSAEQALALSPGGETVCKSLFSQLVHLDADSQPTRRTCNLERLQELDPSTDFETLIGDFVASRLLITDFNTVTISHEAILHAWPRLAGWIDEWRGSAAAVNLVSAAASAWRHTDREPDALLRGAQLALAEDLLTSPASAARLTEGDRQFVLVSADAQDEAERQQLASVSRQLATQAELLRLTDPSISAQVAMVAYTTAATVESRSALLSATSPLPSSRVLGSPGQSVVAASRDGRLVVFTNPGDHSIMTVEARSSDQNTRQMRCALDGGAVVLAVDVSADGQIVAAGDANGRVSLWKTGTTSAPVAQRTNGFDFVGPVHAVCFDRGGERLVTAGVARGIALWQVSATLDLSLERVMASPGTTLAVSISDDSKWLAAGNDDGTVALWDPAEPSEPKWHEPGQDQGPAAGVALSADAEFLAAGYHNGHVRVWAIQHSPLRLTELDIEAPTFASWVNDVQFSQCGKVLAAASSDGSTRLWETAEWTKAHDDLRHPTVVTAVTFVDKATLATTAEDGTLRVWDISEVHIPNQAESIWSISYDRHGHRRATASRSRVAIYSIAPDGAETLQDEIAPHAGAAFSGASAVSPDGSLVAIGTRAGPILLAPIGDNKPTITLTGLTSLVENIAIAPDQSLLCGVDRDGNVHLWTISGGSQPSGASSMQVEAPGNCPAFASDSTLLAVTSESGTVTLFDVADPTRPTTVATIRVGESFALGVAFHPVKPLLAVGNADRSVSIWDCADPAHPHRLNRLTGPAGHTISVKFNATGDLLATGTTDGRIWIWDTANLADPALHAIIKSPQIHSVYATAFSPVHNTITGAGPHQRISTWLLDEEQAVEEICRSIGDPITHREWNRHLPSVAYRELFSTSLRTS